MEPVASEAASQPNSTTSAVECFGSTTSELGVRGADAVVAARRWAPSQSSCGTILKDWSSVMNHSDSGFGNCRRRPVFGSRRVSVRFQIQRATYFSFRSSRWPVAGDQPFCVLRRPGTPSAFNRLTIPLSELPPTNSSKIRRITAASRGSIVIL